MTDNPTPNDIALLREALAGLEWTDDGYTLRVPYDGDVDGDGRHVVVGGDTVATFADSDEGDSLRVILAALAPGQHDGAAGEGQASDAAKAAFNDAFDAYAQHMGDPDGRDDYEAANNAAGLVLDAFAKPSTEQARAEGALSADIRRLVIAARIVTDAGIMDEDERELLGAVEAFSSRVPYDDEPTPSGADGARP